MKKLITTFILIAVGAGAWGLVSQSARFSLKKWDATFESALRHQLDASGLTNQDLLSSVHEVMKDKEGDWTVHRLSIRLPDTQKREALKGVLEKSGARVTRDQTHPSEVWRVKRGSRTYQEITFIK